MLRHIHLVPHLTDGELHDRYRRAGDAVERSHWHFLWLLASGMTATAVTGHSAYWIGQIARRYNTNGPDGVRDRRHTTCAGQADSRHVQADPQARADFKQLLRLLLREVARAISPRCQDRR
jgi:hypothetical protein